MSLTKLPSGRWRAQVYDPARGQNVSVSRMLGGSGTFATRAEAKRARELARTRLGEDLAKPVTLAVFWERWTTDPLFARPKESTNIHNRERTKAFVARYGTRPIDAIDDSVVAEWLAGGSRNGTVPALRAMFNDAASAKAGRVALPVIRSHGLGSRVAQVAGTSSHRARSRSGRSSGALASWQRRRLPHGCKSPRSRGCGPASSTRYGA